VSASTVFTASLNEEIRQERTGDGSAPSLRRSRLGRRFLLALVFALAALATALAPHDASASPVRLDFNTLPPASWQANKCETGSATASGGILTIDSPSCFEYILDDPNAPWYATVSNARGWAIETRLRLALLPGGGASCESDDNGVVIWAHDRSMLVKVSVATGGVCLLYPDQVSYAMDTTGAFHTYRVETKGLHVRILVDGVLRIDHTLSVAGDGSQLLYFGDGSGGTPSRSYWDYFEYDTFGDNLCHGQAPTIVGTAGDDTLTGTAGPDVIVGLGGSDTISGLEGADRICGGSRLDFLNGGPGNDRIAGGAGSDTLVGGEGNDTLRGGDTDSNASYVPGPGNDTIHGGMGPGETIYFGQGPVWASLAAGTATGDGSDTFDNVEHLSGTNENDTLIGDGSQNHIRGWGGNDTIYGGAASDALSGGVGQDRVYGERGDDALGESDYPEDGADYFSGGRGSDVARAGQGADTILGGLGSDWLFGEAGADHLDGRDGIAGNDSVDGGFGPEIDMCFADAGDALSNCP
jgi:Ca2+-binding RTX toxin-like protein